MPAMHDRRRPWRQGMASVCCSPEVCQVCDDSVRSFVAVIGIREFAGAVCRARPWCEGQHHQGDGRCLAARPRACDARGRRCKSIPGANMFPSSIPGHPSSAPCPTTSPATSASQRRNGPRCKPCWRTAWCRTMAWHRWTKRCRLFQRLLASPRTAECPTFGFAPDSVLLAFRHAHPDLRAKTLGHVAVGCLWGRA